MSRFINIVLSVEMSSQAGQLMVCIMSVQLGASLVLKVLEAILSVHIARRTTLVPDLNKYYYGSTLCSRLAVGSVQRESPCRQHKNPLWLSPTAPTLMTLTQTYTLPVSFGCRCSNSISFY